jgi:hypothetical protein
MSGKIPADSAYVRPAGIPQAVSYDFHSAGCLWSGDAVNLCPPADRTGLQPIGLCAYRSLPAPGTAQTSTRAGGQAVPGELPVRNLISCRQSVHMPASGQRYRHLLSLPGSPLCSQEHGPAGISPARELCSVSASCQIHAWLQIRACAHSRSNRLDFFGCVQGSTGAYNGYPLFP